MAATEEQIKNFLVFGRLMLRDVADATGIPLSVVVGQSALETQWGTSPGFLEHNNPAGIMRNGQLRHFDKIGDGLDAYADALNLSYYDAVRAAPTASEAARALGDSPWDAGHYGGHGRNLIAVLEGRDLFKLDEGRPSIGDRIRNVPGRIRDEVGGAAGDVVDAVFPDVDARRIVITAVLAAASLGLIVLGAWRTMPPEVRGVAASTAALTPAGRAAKAVA